jgi:hypothetical protein
MFLKQILERFVVILQQPLLFQHAWFLFKVIFIDSLIELFPALVNLFLIK